MFPKCGQYLQIQYHGLTCLLNSKLFPLQTLKACGAVEVWLYTLVTMTLNVGDWSSSHLYHSACRWRATCTPLMGDWLGISSSLVALEKGKALAPSSDWTTIPQMSRPYASHYTNGAGSVPNARAPICQLLQECDWQEKIQLKVDFEPHSVWCWGWERERGSVRARVYSQSYNFNPPCAFMAWCRLSKVSSLPLLFFFLCTVRWGLYFLQFQSLGGPRWHSD